ncbi:MAG: SAF domain-containing protein [Microthrixaceae bacterium]
MAFRLSGAALALAAIWLAGCGSDSGPSGAASTTSTECASTLDTTKVPVLVIADDITAGTTAEDAIARGSLVEKEIAAGYRPATAVDSLDDMTGGVAIADLAPNQIVVVNQWGLPADVAVGKPPQSLCPR